MLGGHGVPLTAHAPHALALLLATAGCPDDEPSGVPPLPDDDTDPGVDDDTAPIDDDTTGPDDDSSPPEELMPPPEPVYPDVINHLSVAARTAPTEYSGTDDNTLSLCLTADRCFPLNVPDVDDFRVGELDIYHWEGVGLSRSEVDRVEVRSVNGNNQWEFDCLELRFDGEPVYCQDGLAVEMGNGPGELESWSDPLGLHNACTTCQGSSLTHGPIVGPPDPDAVRLYIRTDATRLVALRLGRSDGLVFPFVDYRWTEPSRSFQTVLRAGGLDAGTEYHAFIDVDGVQLAGPIPIWTAPPAGSATPLRLGFGSCTRDDSQPIFSAVADADLDAFFFVGDNHYGDTANLDALRWNYRWAHARPGRREFMSAVPTLAIWDDHDYVGNNTDGSAAGKATALRAFAESWPNPSFGEPGLDGVFFRWSWGEVDVFGLDDRYWRGEDGSVLGAPQTDWIVAELAASTATWKVVALGSQWTADGSNDSWASFLPARDALLTTLGDLGIAGIVFIDGDIHRTEIRSLDVAAFLG